MNHLNKSVQKIASQDDATRINLINSGRWIKYPAAEKILTRLEELLIHPKILRMPNLLIVGETNNGKTVLVNHFHKLHKPIINEIEEKITIPVVYVQSPSQPDEKKFFRKLLDQLNAPYRENDKAERLEKQAYQVLRHVGAKMLIIDEIHNVLAGNTSKQRTFLNVIKSLANELQIVIVTVGIREALNAMNTDSQISNRFIPTFLPKWHYDEDFIGLLVSLESLIPLQKPSNLMTEEISQKILSMSEGTIGEITNIIIMASIEGIKSKKECIDLAILKKIDYVRPSERRRIGERLL